MIDAEAVAMFSQLLQVCVVLSLLSYSHSDDQCGHKGSAGNLVNELKSMTNEWPWLASLYHIESQTFFCAGTIISMNHVLTAAHCIQSKGDSYCRKADEILAYFGKYNFTYTHERGSEILYPTEVFVHPQWNRSSSRYDADIAILYSDEAIRFKSRVSPICLWNEDITMDFEGTVVGWNMQDALTTNGYQEAQVKTVPSLMCYEDYHYFALLSSNRTFCATGLDEESTPCIGNSGKRLKFNSICIILIHWFNFRRWIICAFKRCLAHPRNIFGIHH